MVHPELAAATISSPRESWACAAHTPTPSPWWYTMCHYAASCNAESTLVAWLWVCSAAVRTCEMPGHSVFNRSEIERLNSHCLLPALSWMVQHANARSNRPELAAIRGLAYGVPETTIDRSMRSPCAGRRCRPDAGARTRQTNTSREQDFEAASVSAATSEGDG